MTQTTQGPTPTKGAPSTGGSPLAPLPGQAPEPQVKTSDQQAESDEMKELAARRRGRSAFSGEMIRRAIKDSFVKLDPRTLAKNPVMFVVEVGSVITTIATVQAIASGAENAG